MGDVFYERQLPPIAIDAIDGDWIKRCAWDIPARSAPDLREWLFHSGVSVDEFKTFEVYRSHVDRPGFEWLRDL
ncbi:MAG: hypothetical protein ACXVRS_12225 [Gaiellaceae bacterium]